MGKKAKVVLLIIIFISAIFNIAISWNGIANTMSWIFDYIARPMLILLLIISIITVIITTIYCFVKKKLILIVSISIFVCMVIYSSFVYSSFSISRPQPESMKVFIDLTDVENLNILNISNFNKSISKNEIRTSVLGKNTFEIEYYTWSGRQNDYSEDYSISQEIFGYDNTFFVNRKKLEEHLTFYYIEKDIWGFDITDNDIYSFTKDNINCTYVYKTKVNEHSPEYNLAYYSFVISNEEKIYVASYNLMCTNSFNFNAEQTTERILDELISKNCL